MSKFNTIQKTTKVLNEAGGLAYQKSLINEFVSHVLNSFVTDTYYRTGDKSLNALREMIKKLDPIFVAKTAIYARNVCGMRSISHVLASELSDKVSGKTWAKSFYEKVVSRPDDITEILSYYYNMYHIHEKLKLPNSMKKGLGKSFDKFDEYQLAKYRQDNKQIKLIDAVNLLHPVPTDKNREALNLLVNDKLRNTKTWESMLSKAGQEAENEEDLLNNKSNAWEELVTTRKIGYFALLRNLKNIINHAPHIIDDVCTMLTDERLIKNSKVLPFRFAKAYDVVKDFTDETVGRKAVNALNKAIDISLSNIPEFDGETLVAVDISGSMQGRPSEIAAIFAAAFIRKNNSDIVVFNDYAKYVSYNPQEPLFELSKKFNFTPSGTSIASIFDTANKKYDRIIILSDMQDWIDNDKLSMVYNNYKNKYNANPTVFSWDLTGYSTTVLPESKIHCLSGFSESSFDIMANLEKDRNYLFNQIMKIEL